MKRLFIDSDIILDSVLKRPQFVEHANRVLRLISNDLICCTSSHCLMNVFYINRKAESNLIAKQKLSLLLDHLTVFDVTEAHLRSAVTSAITDFEDAVQHEVAKTYQCDYIITRNLPDYKHAELPVLTAEQYLTTL